MSEASPDETREILLRGKVELLQARRGYRTSVDAMLLAVFSAAMLDDGLVEDVVDLGAGSGLVGLLLALHAPRPRLHLIERQATLLARARRNLARHGVAARATLTLCDIEQQRALEPVASGRTLVVCNPPFYRAAGRTLPPNAERRDAHYESTASLERFAEVAAAQAGVDGVTAWVYPAAGAPRLLAALDAAGLVSQRLRPARHMARDAQPNRVLVAAKRGPPARTQEADWAVRLRDPPDGRYADDIEAFLAGLPPLPP